MAFSFLYKITKTHFRKWKLYSLLSSMCDCFWDLLETFPYLYTRRAKANAPTAERAKSTYSAISALCDVKANPRKRTLLASPGWGSVGVTVQGKTIRRC